MNSMDNNDHGTGEQDPVNCDRLHKALVTSILHRSDIDLVGNCILGETKCGDR
jgi:hypothetical protein